MNETTKHKLWTKNFSLLCALNFTLFIGFHMQVATFAFFIKHLGGGEALAGLAAGLFSVSSVIMRPIAGWVLDNKSRNILLLIGISGMFLIPLGYAFCTMLTLVLAMRLIHGITWASCTTSTNTVVSDILPRDHFGQGMGWFGLTASISSAIAPTIGLFLMDNYGFTIFFLTASLSALLAMFFFLLVKIRPLPEKNRTDFRHSLKTLLNKNALPASLTMLFFMLPYGATMTFAALYASTTDYLPQGGMFFLCLAGTAAVVRVTFGWVIDRYGEKIIVYVSTTGMMVALLLLAYWPTVPVFYLSAALIGFGMGTLSPSMQTMAMRIATPERRGAASSTYLMAFDIGTGLGGIIAGVLVELFGYHHMFALMSVFAVLSLLTYFFWGRNHPSSFSYAKSAE